VFKYEWLYEEPGLDLFTDSDWAGCRRTRKFTTGGVVMRGPHCLKTWSVTQGPIALSSAEAEYYSMVDGVVKAIGIQSLSGEIGLEHLSGPIRLHTDSSSAKSFASRRGLGRARHIDTRCLWLQMAVADSKVLVSKIAGTRNPANLLTKYIGAEAISREAAMMGIVLQWRPGALGSGRGGCGRQPRPVRVSTVRILVEWIGAVTLECVSDGSLHVTIWLKFCSSVVSKHSLVLLQT
jgi:hypothetical protein